MPRTFRLNDNEIKTSSLHGSIRQADWGGTRPETTSQIEIEL